MRVPHRYEIRLRPGPGGTLECRHEDQEDWRNTGLSLDKPLDDDGRRFADLLGDLRHDNEADDLETALPRYLQARIGRQLFVALFGEGAREFGDRRIHIVLEPGAAEKPQEFLDLALGLPWGLLTESNQEAAPFLALRADRPAAITIDATPRRSGDQPIFGELKMPLFPELLLIGTDTDPGKPTGAKAHCETLWESLAPPYVPEERLIDGGDMFDRGEGRIRFARTFDQVNAQLSGRGFEPQIIYYYGHARVDDDDTVLEFENSRGGRDNHKLDDLVELLRSRRSGKSAFPPIVWINACKSGVARRSAVRQLAPFASVVIATRAAIGASVAAELGLGTLKKIVLEGEAPPLALRDTIHELSMRHPSEKVTPAWWAINVMAVQYRLWSLLNPEERRFNDAETVGDLPARLDRKLPLNRIQAQIDKAIETLPDHLGPASLALLWHGTADEGLIAFGRRVEDHLAENYPAWPLRSYRVDLQPDARPKLRPEVHFITSLDCGLRGLDRSARNTDTRLQDIVDTLESFANRRPWLLVLNHGKFTIDHVDLLRDYLSFWKGLLEDYNEKLKNVRVLLCFAVETTDSSGEFALPRYAVRLDRVVSGEINEHLKRFSGYYNLSGEAARKKEVDRLMGKTDRRFRPLYDELQTLFNATLRGTDEV